MQRESVQSSKQAHHIEFATYTLNHQASLSLSLKRRNYIVKASIKSHSRYYKPHSFSRHILARTSSTDHLMQFARLHIATRVDVNLSLVVYMMLSRKEGKVFPTHRKDMTMSQVMTLVGCVVLGSICFCSFFLMLARYCRRRGPPPSRLVRHQRQLPAGTKWYQRVLQRHSCPVKDGCPPTSLPTSVSPMCCTKPSWDIEANAATFEEERDRFNHRRDSSNISGFSYGRGRKGDGIISSVRAAFGRGASVRAASGRAAFSRGGLGAGGDVAMPSMGGDAKMSVPASDVPFPDGSLPPGTSSTQEQQPPSPDNPLPDNPPSIVRLPTEPEDLNANLDGAGSYVVSHLTRLVQYV